MTFTMIKAQLILAIYLLTSGWSPTPPTGVIMGKSYSAPFCAVTVGDDPVYVLPEPVCFEERYLLFVGPDGFRVSEDVWGQYEIEDDYP